MKTYGDINFKQVDSKTSLICSEISNLGFYLFKDALSNDLIDALYEGVNKVYKDQEKEFQKNRMLIIGEENIARSLFAYDDIFYSLLDIEQVNSVVAALLGGYYYTLNLQNAIISRPQKTHVQSSWHRDIPYQNFICNEVLSLNVYVPLTKYSFKTGGTQLLPYSHNQSIVPGGDYIMRNFIQPEMGPGDVLFFHSMILHRAGVNQSNTDRVGINQIFTRPFMKAQIMFDDSFYNSVPAKYRSLLDCDYFLAKGVSGYRESKYIRKT